MWLRRYYPEYLPPEALPTPVDESASQPGTSPPPFDFNAEMHQTRVIVDRLLAQGKIDDAESYMEQRRVFFWENGYHIRKLNQAYFAFYGAYADQPAGSSRSRPGGDSGAFAARKILVPGGFY